MMDEEYLKEMEESINAAVEAGNLEELEALFDDVANTYKKSVDKFNNNLSKIFAELG